MTVEIVQMSRHEAEEATAKVVADLNSVADRIEAISAKIIRLYDMRADQALGYASWEAYVDDRFGGIRDRITRLDKEFLHKGLASRLPLRAIAPVTGTDEKTIRRDIEEAEGAVQVRQSAAVAPPKKGLDNKVRGIKDADYDRIAAYIKENPESSQRKTAKDLGIDRHKVLRWAKDTGHEWPTKQIDMVITPEEKADRDAQIAAYVKENPTATAAEVSEKVGVPPTSLKRWAKTHGHTFPGTKVAVVEDESRPRWDIPEGALPTANTMMQVAAVIQAMKVLWTKSTEDDIRAAFALIGGKPKYHELVRWGGQDADWNEWTEIQKRMVAGE